MSRNTRKEKRKRKNTEDVLEEEESEEIQYFEKPKTSTETTSNKQEQDFEQEFGQEIQQKEPIFKPTSWIDCLKHQLNPTENFNYLPPLLKQPYEQLNGFLQNCIENHLNDSIMIIGPRKTGKKHVINYCLKELKKTMKYSKFQSIYIDGSIVENDILFSDYLIEELQSCNPYKFKNNKNKRKEEEEEENEMNEFDNFDEEVKSIELLNNLKKFKNQSIIIILDNFENLCKKSEKMLYTITDTCHEKNLSIILIGITTCSSIALKMDRRVRSRFSSRKIYTFLPKNRNDIISIIEHYLLIKNNEEFKNYLKNYLNDKEMKNIEIYNLLLKKCFFDEKVLEICEELIIRSDISMIYKWICKVFEFIYLHYNKSDYNNDYNDDNLMKDEEEDNNSIEWITSEILINQFNILFNKYENTRLSFLQKLNQCQLILLCAIKKKEALSSDKKTIELNFETIYELYMNFVTGSNNNNSKNIKSEFILNEGKRSVEIDKEIIFKNYLNLIEMNIIKFNLKDIPLNKKDQQLAKIRLNNIQHQEIENEMNKLFKEKKLDTMTIELFEWQQSLM
ncbi:hypothetical protein ABK040_004996 [Willaertia magna]